MDYKDRVHQILKQFVFEKSKTPAELFHYTTAAGLIGIIRLNSFWASNWSFLNDRGEGHYGRAILTRELIDRYSPKHPEAVRIVLEQLQNHHPWDNYVVSFCENGDLLSQWRGYGLGYSLGVNLRDQNFGEAMVHRMLYGDEHAEAFFDKIEQNLSDQFDQDFAEILKNNPLAVVRYIRMLGDYFKDPAFSEEKEWRLSKSQNGLATNLSPPDALMFRDRGSDILPYIELKADGPMSVSRVCMGPGVQPENAHSLRGLLQRNGHNEVSIVQASGFYRP